MIRHKWDLAVLVLAMMFLLSIAMPLLVAQNESSRSNKCRENMRILGQSILGYESTYGTFPTAATIFRTSTPWVSTGRENGLTFVGPTWSVQLTLDSKSPTFDGDVSRLVLEFFSRKRESGADWDFHFADDFTPLKAPEYLKCPSAMPASLLHSSRLTQLDNLSKGNYAACIGAGSYLEAIDNSSKVDELLIARFSGKPSQRRGVITPRMVVAPRMGGADEPYAGLWETGIGRGVKVRRIKDGLANTVILSEVLAVDGNGRIANRSDDIRGAWQSVSMGGSTYSHKTLPNSPEKDRVNGCERDDAEVPSSRLRCIEQPSMGPTAGDTFAAARSDHPGGVMAMRADGSVEFCSNQINAKVWASLATRDGDD